MIVGILFIVLNCCGGHLLRSILNWPDLGVLAEARRDSLFLRDFLGGFMFFDETFDISFLFIPLSISDNLSIYFWIQFYLVRYPTLFRTFNPFILFKMHLIKVQIFFKFILFYFRNVSKKCLKNQTKISKITWLSFPPFRYPTPKQVLEDLIIILPLIRNRCTKLPILSS